MPKDKPVKRFRLRSITAAIWRNQTDKGPRFNTTISRSYKDGEEWKSIVGSFGRDDLLLVAKVADQAHTWIHDQTKPEEDGDEPVEQTSRR